MFKKISSMLTVLVLALVFSVATVSAAPVSKLTPFVDCISILNVDPTSGFTWYYAHFGYTSIHNNSMTVPYGPNNTAQPWSVGSYGFPTVFYPGTHHDVFQLSMLDHMEWKLGDKVAVADTTTPLCQ
jgi:hypothetical protein